MFSDNTLQTLIATVGPVLVAYIGYRAARPVVQRNAARKKAEAASVPTLPMSPDQQQQFIQTLMQDREQNREDKREDRAQIQANQVSINDLQKQLAERDTRELTFTEALGRWLARLFRDWPPGFTMPMPEGEDLDTLSHIIPRG